MTDGPLYGRPEGLRSSCAALRWSLLGGGPEHAATMKANPIHRGLVECRVILASCSYGCFAHAAE